jgi:hypothetical protein
LARSVRSRSRPARNACSSSNVARPRTAQPTRRLTTAGCPYAREPAHDEVLLRCHRNEPLLIPRLSLIRSETDMRLSPSELRGEPNGGTGTLEHPRIARHFKRALVGHTLSTLPGHTLFFEYSDGGLAVLRVLRPIFVAWRAPLCHPTQIDHPPRSSRRSRMLTKPRKSWHATEPRRAGA